MFDKAAVVNGQDSSVFRRSQCGKMYIAADVVHLGAEPFQLKKNCQPGQESFADLAGDHPPDQTIFCSLEIRPNSRKRTFDAEITTGAEAAKNYCDEWVSGQCLRCLTQGGIVFKIEPGYLLGFKIVQYKSRCSTTDFFPAVYVRKCFE